MPLNDDVPSLIKWVKQYLSNSIRYEKRFYFILLTGAVLRTLSSLTDQRKQLQPNFQWTDYWNNTKVDTKIHSYIFLLAHAVAEFFTSFFIESTHKQVEKANNFAMFLNNLLQKITFGCAKKD